MQNPSPMTAMKNEKATQIPSSQHPMSSLCIELLDRLYQVHNLPGVASCYPLPRKSRRQGRRGARLPLSEHPFEELKSAKESIQGHVCVLQCLFAEQLGLLCERKVAIPRMDISGAPF